MSLPVGARVHHRGSIHSRADREGHGWGTVLEAVPQHDGSTEYLVQRDKPLLPDWPNEPTWWASYHIDRTYEGEEAAGG